MDPASIVSLAGGCLKIVVGTAKELRQLRRTFKDYEQDINLVQVRLDTIQATLSQLDSWLQAQQRLAPQLIVDFGLAMTACETVVKEIQAHVSRVNSGSIKAKARHLWDEASFTQHQKSLDSQIAALALFLNVIIL